MEARESLLFNLAGLTERRILLCPALVCGIKLTYPFQGRCRVLNNK